MDEKFIFAQAKSFNENGELEAVASTGVIDRDNEIIEPDAWTESLGTYRSNPVILAAHTHRLLTGGSPVIGSAAKIDVAKEELIFSMRFAGTDLAKEYEQLYRDQHMRAFSVGFIPQNGEWRDFDRSGKPKRLWVHTKVDLLEISAVAVPANPEALARMRAAMAKFNEQALAGKLTDVKSDVAAEVIGQLKDAGIVGPDESGLKLHIDATLQKFSAQLLDAISELREEIQLSSDTLGQVSPLDQDAPKAGEGPAGHGEGAEGAKGKAVLDGLIEHLKDR